LAKVSSKYDPEFVEFLKSIGGKWNPENRTWTVPENKIANIRSKAKELNVKNLKIQLESSQQPKTRQKASLQSAEGTIKMRLSKDGRFVLISVDLIAFASDVKQMLEGKRRTVRFRILPPRQ